METKLRNGGYTVFTSLDPDVQSAVQDIITNWSDYPPCATPTTLRPRSRSAAANT